MSPARPSPVDRLNALDIRIAAAPDGAIAQTLKRKRRDLLGGLASGRARQDPERDRQIILASREYTRRDVGTVEAVAARFGVSARTVNRVLKKFRQPDGSIALPPPPRISRAKAATSRPRARASAPPSQTPRPPDIEAEEQILFLKSELKAAQEALTEAAGYAMEAKAEPPDLFTDPHGLAGWIVDVTRSAIDRINVVLNSPNRLKRKR